MTSSYDNDVALSIMLFAERQEAGREFAPSSGLASFQDHRVSGQTRGSHPERRTVHAESNSTGYLYRALIAPQVFSVPFTSGTVAAGSHQP
jgi:hypothetical protein